jgi:hypothetical protein
MPARKKLYEALILAKTFKGHVLVLAKDEEHAESLLKKMYPYCSIIITEFDREVIQ